MMSSTSLKAGVEISLDLISESNNTVFSNVTYNNSKVMDIHTDTHGFKISLA